MPAFRIQDAPTMIPATPTIGRGPHLSTRYPLIGPSHVSQTMKIVKATWMAARSQPKLCCSGATKSVQPYCRLAIIVMATTPMISCTQGLAKPKARGRDSSFIRFAPQPIHGFI